MPSHTAASVLIKLWMYGEAPWSWPTWQDHTQITSGLFPADDTDLPKGWSRCDADNIKSFFKIFWQKSTEEDCMKLVRGRDKIPGRELWKSWVAKNWNRWKINTVIVDVLREEKVHPVSLMVADDNLDSWPTAEVWVPTVLDQVCIKLFGEEVLDPTTGHLPTKYRAPLQTIVQRTWESIRKQFR
jgi:hypothetical protein